MIQEQISTMVQNAIDGEVSAAEVFATLKAIEAQVKHGIGAVKESAILEAENFNKEEKYYGGKWEIRNGVTTLNFKCDKEFTHLDAALKMRKKDLTNAWKMKQEGKGFFDETGEVVPIVEVKSYGDKVLVFKPE